MGTWNNADGLHVKFGTSEGVSGHNAGELNMLGPVHILELEVELSELTQTETILNDVVMLPDNCQVVWVRTTTEVAAVTGTAIDVGTIAKDRTTEVDYNGLLAAFPTGNMNTVGETVRFTAVHTELASVTGTGAQIGTIITQPCYISASMTDATAFTAGRILIEVAYRAAALAAN